MKKFSLYLERVQELINEDVYYFFESQDKMITLMNEILSIIQGSYGEKGSRIKGSYSPDDSQKAEDKMMTPSVTGKELEQRLGEGIYLDAKQKQEIEDKYNQIFALLQNSIETGTNAISPENTDNFFKGMNILHRAIYRTKEATLGDSLRNTFEDFLMYIETKLLILSKTTNITFDVGVMKSYIKGLKSLFKSNLLIHSGTKDQYLEILKMVGLK